MRASAFCSELLEATNHDSVCLVTHKGFLRELERGPLGRSTASEFGNCEVRVWQLLRLPAAEARAAEGGACIECSLLHPAPAAGHPPEPEATRKRARAAAGRAC